MHLRCLRNPGLHLAALQLVDPVALRTDEMVVMSRSAKPVAALAGPVRQLVDDLALTEDGQGAVNGGETYALALVTEPRMDLLSRRVVRLGGERLEHAQALPRGTDAGAAQALGQYG